MRSLKRLGDIAIACILAFLVLGSFMAICALIFFLVSLFIVVCQEYPLYIFPAEGIAWVILSWIIHRKLDHGHQQAALPNHGEL